MLLTAPFTPSSGFEHLGFRLGMWFGRPTDETDSTQIHTLLKLRRQSENPRSTNVCDKYGIDLLVQQVGNALVVDYRSSEQFFVPCQRFTMSFRADAPALAHLEISLENHRQSFALNGVELGALFRPFNENLSHWQTQSLELLSSEWGGTLYQLSLFSSDSSEPIIFSDELPLTPPLSLPTLINSKMRSLISSKPW